jgi:hypothetical protein
MPEENSPQINLVPQVPVPPVAPALVDPPKAEQVSTPSPLKQIRTFEGDVADAIKKQNESLISIQRKEENRRDAVRTLAPNVGGEEQRSFKPLLMSLVTIVLIAGGGYASYYAWTTYSEKTALPITETLANQFISATLVTDVDASTLGRQALIDLVEQTRLKERGGSELEQLEFRRGTEPTSELLSTADFLTRLASHAPNPLVRSFNPLFMLGVLGGDSAHSVLIIKLDSFENAFPGMLGWEGRLVEDLMPIFISREELQDIPTISEFKDKTIQNHDTRILRDSSGKIVLLYGFFDNKMLIITDNEESFRTILNRLQSEKLSR